MTPLVRRMLFWIPRLLCIAFAIFLAMFALDVFNEDLSPGTLIFALTVHLLPALLLLAILALSWEWEWVGGLVFFGLAIFYFFSTVGRMHWSAWAIISGGLFTLGFLFMVDWVYHDQLHVKA